MDWIIANKEWLFSGLLVAVPIALLGWLIRKRHISRSQTQKAGDHSVNIQVGGSIEVGGVPRNERPDTKSRR
jgi:hypothetical protein